jgi:peptide/nickel transport system substrate-binding protein
LAYVLPAQAPAGFVRGRPQPGTGPYTIAAFSARRGVRLVRNPRFASGSAAARPDGYPDAITVNFSRDGAAQLAAVEQGRADAFLAAGGNSPQVSLDQARTLTLTDASHVHTAPFPVTTWLFLNVRERPLNDPRVRRALNYAIDRRRVVALAGGGGQASMSCQVIPPGLPGYSPTCPFTRSPTRAGSWSAPDIARARRLVAASGTRGARVQVWSPPKFAAVFRYVGAVLHRLGYRVKVRVLPDVGRYFDYVNDTRHHAQAGFYAWVTDYLTPSSFFDPFSCSEARRNPDNTATPSRFCDRGVEAADRAALAARGTEANTRWAALDRRVTAASPAIPLFTRRTLLLVSDRVGNAQTHEQLGPLLDQFWVR